MNYVAKLNFGNASASLARPAVVSDILRHLLSEQELWAVVEPFALPPGVCGSRSFDQANIVRLVKEFDEAHGGKLKEVDMNDRMLWNYVYREMQKVFTCSAGRVLGLLEDKSQSPDASTGNGADIE